MLVDYRFDGHDVQSLKAGGGGLIPIVSPATTKLTKPPILRRSKHHKGVSLHWNTFLILLQINEIIHVTVWI